MATNLKAENVTLIWLKEEWSGWQIDRGERVGLEQDKSLAQSDDTYFKEGCCC